MRTHAKAVRGSGLLFTGVLLLTGCDDPQLPQAPGVEEQEDTENQGGNPDNGQDDNQDDGPDDESDEQEEN